MNFAFTEEQDELRKTVRAFLDSKSPETAVREQMETETGLRPRRLDADGRADGSAGPGHPRGVRRLGLQLRRARHRARGDGPRPAVRAVLLHRRARRQHAAAVGRRRRQEGATCPGIASGETIATLAFTEPSGKWDESGITMEATGSGDGWKLNGTKMFVIDGHTADADHRRRPHGQRRQPVHRRRRRRRPHPHAAVDDGPDPQAGQARVRRHAGHAARHRGRGLGRAVDRARPRRRRPRRRAGRRRPEGARDGRRVRQGARPVRPPDRLVPGDQAQVRRHAARGRVGQVGGVLRHVVRRRR